MTDLNKVSADIETILAREVTRIVNNTDQMDDKGARVLELLSKVLDACQDRRAKLPAADPFAEMSDDELAKDFE